MTTASLPAPNRAVTRRPAPLVPMTWRQWVREHRVGIVVLGAILLVAAIAHAVGIGQAPPRLDDEGTYIAQAWSLQHWGRLAPYTYWYDHPPLGWIQLAALTRFRTGVNAVTAGREIVLVYRLAAVALVFLILRRVRVHLFFAALGTLAFALSPLSLVFGRYVYLDNLAVTWLLAAFALACAPRRSLAAAAGSAVCLAVAVLTKETTALLAPAVLWMLWQRSDRRLRAMHVTIFSVLVATIVFAYPLYAVLKSELVPGSGHVSLLWAVQWQLFARESSGNVLAAGSGANGLVRYWLGIDAWLVVGGALCTVPALFVRRLRPLALASAIQLLGLLRGGYLPEPYVVAMLPFAAIMLASVADAFWFGPDPVDGEIRTWSWVPAGISRPFRALRRDLVAAAASTPGRTLTRGIVALVALLSLGLIVPAWTASATAAAYSDRDAPLRSAQAYLAAHADRDAHLVVDDSLWVDLVAGQHRDANDVLWVYKLDLDPAVTPPSYKSLDYLVLVDEGVYVRRSSAMPTLRDALANSDVVARWGSGRNEVTIRKVQK